MENNCPYEELEELFNSVVNLDIHTGGCEGTLKVSSILGNTSSFSEEEKRAAKSVIKNTTLFFLPEEDVKRIKAFKQKARDLFSRFSVGGACGKVMSKESFNDFFPKFEELKASYLKFGEECSQRFLESVEEFKRSLNTAFSALCAEDAETLREEVLSRIPSYSIFSSSFSMEIEFLRPPEETLISKTHPELLGAFSGYKRATLEKRLKEIQTALVSEAFCLVKKLCDTLNEAEKSGKEIEDVPSRLYSIVCKIDGKNIFGELDINELIQKLNNLAMEELSNCEYVFCLEDVLSSIVSLAENKEILLKEVK